MSANCEIIHQWFTDLKEFSFPFEKNEIPENGIYILFEKGEIGHGVQRIVRVGTHTGHNQLRSRLRQHFIKENKDRSIFRKNIGRAILNRGSDPFLEHWELDLTTKAAKEKYSKSIDLCRQSEIEKAVSAYIQENFTFVTFQIDDKEQRLLLESKIISTVSLCNECNSSKDWLGNDSPKEKIRESGLWLVNELWKSPLSEDDMGIMKSLLGK